MPLKVAIPRKRRPHRVFHLNLNVYRNSHYQVLNQAKRIFREAIRFQVEALCAPACLPLRLRYVLYMPTRRTVDLTNVCAVVDKFACDALVDLGLLPGDDSSVISSVEYVFGGVDPARPRCELFLEPDGKAGRRAGFPLMPGRRVG